MKTLLDIINKYHREIELIQSRINNINRNLLEEEIKYNKDIINSLFKIKDNLEDINDNLDVIESENYYSFKNKTKDLNERVNDHNINKKIQDIFLPYMMYYRLIMEMNNEI